MKKAAALEPDAFEPHKFLAEAYGQLGRKTDAARERAVAKRLEHVKRSSLLQEKVRDKTVTAGKVRSG